MAITIPWQSYLHQSHLTDEEPEAWGVKQPGPNLSQEAVGQNEDPGRQFQGQRRPCYLSVALTVSNPGEVLQSH